MINFFHLKKNYDQIYLNPILDGHNFNLTHDKIEKKTFISNLQPFCVMNFIVVGVLPYT
jgi:hypothetical protein